MPLKRSILIPLALLISLSACSAAPSEGGDAPSGSADAKPDAPAHILRELRDGVTVDADVTYPARAEYDCYATCAPELTPDFLGELLLAGDESARTVEPVEDPEEWPEYAGFFRMTAEDGSFVYWSNGSLLYDSPRAGRDEKKLASIEEVMSDLSAAEPFNDVELPCMSRDEAEKLVTDILGRLDMIGTPEITSFVGLEHGEIQERAGELFREEDYAWALEIGKLVDLRDLTEEDDAYYISMSFSLDGLPVYGSLDRRLEYAGEPISVNSASVQAYILGGELAELKVDGCLSLSAARVRREPVIDVEAALDTLREKYDLEILSTPLTVTRIYMEYLPYRTTNVDYDLRPYWVLEYGCEGPDGQLHAAGAERINAVTGEDAAYGG